jgi:signal transduction histidine kinase/lipopolysaccharide biosynthesis regulator YciM
MGYLKATNLDSLKRIVNSIPDSEKAVVYIQILKHANFKTSTDSFFHYSERARYYAIKFKDYKNEALANVFLGMYYGSVNKHTNSIDSYNKALIIFKNEKDFSRATKVYREIAEELISQGNYDSAANLLFEALKYCEKNKYDYGKADINSALGRLYRHLGESEKALNCLTIAKEIEENRDQPNQRVIVQIVKLLGLTKYDQNKFDEALNLFQEGLKYKWINESPVDMMTFNNSIAIVYAKQKDYNKALEYYHIALKSALETKSPNLICAARLNIGNTYQLLNQNIIAIKELKAGLEIADKYGFTKWQRYGYLYLSEAYEGLKDHENALTSYIKYKDFSDSLKIEESKQHIAELATKYETEKKEKQIGFLNKENEIQKLKLLASDNKYKGISDSIKIEESKRQIAELETKYEIEKTQEQIEVLNKENEIQTLKLDKNRNNMALMIIAIFILLASGVLYFLYSKQKQKSKEILKKHKYDKQLLSSIISTEDKERKRFASDLHDGLGPLLSSVKLYLSGIIDADETEKPEMVNYATELIDESIKSVRIISNNILPAELSEYGLVPSIQRFTKKIQYSKQIEFSIKDATDEMRFDSSTELILYRVIQELINNSIKHSEADMINIKFSKKDKVLDIFYGDNGKGFDIAEQRSNTQGIGLKNIYERISSLNGNLEIKSSEGQGMQVDIRIKI